MLYFVLETQLIRWRTPSFIMFVRCDLIYGSLDFTTAYGWLTTWRVCTSLLEIGGGGLLKVFPFLPGICATPLWCFVIKHSKQHFLLQVHHLFLNFACMANFCLCVGTQGFPVDIGWECTRLGAIQEFQKSSSCTAPCDMIWRGVAL